MILLSRRSRFLTILCALVQVVLPGALGVADALSSSDGRASTGHIEDARGQQCRAPHTDECIICRHLSTGATRSDPALGSVPQIARPLPPAAVEADPRSVAHRGFCSRAPPEL
jgi:hypothetical protein